VYRARHTKLQRLVALKMIQPPPGTTPQQWESLTRRFRTEAEAVARLQHPNIVQIYECGEHNGLPYFSLEFCGGGSLADRLDGTPWEPARAAGLVETLSRAVHTAHLAQVIHRDLKPANVLLTNQGVPKVSDFGLAKKLDAPGHTQPGAIVGTPSYMPPEQASGKTEAMGPPSDVYSLGAILYELLTGRPPFKAATTLDTVLQVVGEDPVPPRRLQSSVPRHLETICLHCLRKEPARRYATAEALANDLRRFLDGRAPQVHPPGWAERTWLLYRRNKLAGTLLTLLAVAVLVGVSLVTWKWRQADREKTAQVEANRRLQEVVYAGQIALAYREWQANNVAAARRLLEACPAEKRGWEWEYVDRLCHAERLVLEGHEGTVRGVAFDPRGGLLASAGKDGTVRLWGLPDGDAKAVLRGHEGEVSAVAFGPGHQLASGGADASVRLWDPASGAGRIVGKQDKPVVGVAIDPAGRRLASADKQGSVIVWDMAGGSKVTSWSVGKEAWAIAFDPNGARLAAGGESTEGKKEVTVWEVEAAKKVFTYGAPAAVTGVAFDPDGNRLAVSCQSETVQLVDMKDGKVRELHGHRSGVHAVAFSPDGRRVASAGWDSTVCVWPADGEAGARDPIVLRGHSQGASCVAFSADGRRLASGGGDARLRVWTAGVRPDYEVLGEAFVEAAGLAFRPDGRQVASAGWHIRMVAAHSGVTAGEVRLFDTAGGPGQEPLPLRGHDGHLTAVAYAPDNKTATAADDGKILLWDSTTGLFLRQLEGHTGKSLCLAFSADGRQLLSGGDDKVIKVWDWQAGTVLLRLEGHTDAVTALAISADGHWAVSGSADRTVRVWDVSAGPALRVLEGHTDTVTAVALSPDGALIASGSADHGVRLWDRASGALRYVLWGHSGGVQSLAFHPGSRRLASAGGQKLQPGEIKLWDTGSGLEVLTLRNVSGPFSGVAFSPDGTTLASVDTGGLHEGEVRLWMTGPVHELPPPPAATLHERVTLRGHTEGVFGVAFTADGKTLASGSLDKSVRLWDTALGIETGQLRGHTEAVWPVLFLGDGRTLASGGWDRTVKLWDYKDGKEIANFPGLAEAVLTLAATPDGHTLAAGLRDGSVQLLDVVGRRAGPLLRGPEKLVLSVAISPDGTTLAAAEPNGTVRLWDVAGGREKQALPAYMSVMAVAFVSERVVAAAGQDGEPAQGRCQIKLWDTGSGREQFTLRGPKSMIRTLDVAPATGLLAAGTQDGRLWLWDLHTRKLLLARKAHDAALMFLRFAPDGRALATAGGDKMVRLWEVGGHSSRQ
jgi:WD40 repeat protein